MPESVGGRMTIRPITDSDRNLVAELLPGAFRQAWTRHFRVLSYDGQGRPAAAASFRHYPDHVGDIIVAVRREERRRGAGSALVRHMVEFARAHGAAFLRGSADVHVNPEARAFAAANSFTGETKLLKAEVAAENADTVLQAARRPCRGTVRPSRDEDRQPVAALLAEHVQRNRTVGNAAAEDLLAGGVCSHAWVLENDGEVTGAVLARAEGQLLHVEALVVVPRLRNTAAAAHLLAAVHGNMRGIGRFRFAWAAGNVRTAALARHFSACMVSEIQEFTLRLAPAETADSARTSLSV